MGMINVLKQINTEDFTFILPSVSVGNVGQLAIDLLISSHEFKEFATVWDPAIVPSVGGNPFTGNSTDIGTACELFINEKLKIVVMQLRSTIEHKLAMQFFNKLKTSLLNLKFSNVIILTSMFAHELHNINSSHFRYITNDDNKVEALRSLKVMPMETEPICGFGCKLYEILSTDLKCTLLIKYTSEGDNRPDAMQMLSILYGIVIEFQDSFVKQVTFPKSWEFVFGNPPPIGIY